MAKLYLVLLDIESKIHSTILDMDNLPEGIEIEESEDPFMEGMEIVKFLVSSPLYGINLISNIERGTLGGLEKKFISKFVGFWNGLPPAEEEKDAIIVLDGKNGDFIRTSPEIAKQTWDNARGINA